MKIIAAVDEKWGIGKGMNLLFRISEDMEFFKEKTMGKTVVMGRKTLESFPNAKPLNVSEKHVENGISFVFCAYINKNPQSHFEQKTL